MSHHADYEDIEHELEEYGATDFEDLAESFADAVRDDADDAKITHLYDALLTALHDAEATSGASDYQQLMSIKELVSLAAAEYEGGVEAEGEVEIPIEYRDSWGFLETARSRAKAIAQGDDADLAVSGREILQQLEGTEALYPGLTADEAATDASLLNVAAGWIEIIALRLK